MNQPLPTKSQTVTVTNTAGRAVTSADAAQGAANAIASASIGKVASLSDSALLTRLLFGRTAFRHLRDNGEPMVEAVHIEMVQLAESSRLTGSPLILQVVNTKIRTCVARLFKSIKAPSRSNEPRSQDTGLYAL